MHFQLKIHIIFSRFIPTHDIRFSSDQLPEFIFNYKRLVGLVCQLIVQLRTSSCSTRFSGLQILPNYVQIDESALWIASYALIDLNLKNNHLNLLNVLIARVQSCTTYYTSHDGIMRLINQCSLSPTIKQSPSYRKSTSTLLINSIFHLHIDINTVLRIMILIIATYLYLINH